MNISQQQCCCKHKPNPAQTAHALESNISVCKEFWIRGFNNSSLYKKFWKKIRHSTCYIAVTCLPDWVESVYDFENNAHIFNVYNLHNISKHLAVKWSNVSKTKRLVKNQSWYDIKCKL